MRGTGVFYRGAKWLMCFIILLAGPAAEAEEVDMNRVRALAKLPVKEILKTAPVKELDHATYWDIVMQSPKPVMVMFYSNEEDHSQNLATLFHYVASDFRDRILFCSFMVAPKGQPGQEDMTRMEKLYGLEKTPGVLFYDNDPGKMVLEHKHYEIPKFESYKTPGMMLWELYYSKVEKIIREKILD